MKSIFKIIFVIIGTLIGAGFASGQEMYTFFFSYGIKGLIGILISSILMGVIIYKTLNIVNKYDISNYRDFINTIINFKFKKKYLNIKNIFILVINIFIIVTFFIMIAGFGAYFNQIWQINKFIRKFYTSFSLFYYFFRQCKKICKN